MPTGAPVGGTAELSPLKPNAGANPSHSWAPGTAALVAVAAGGTVLLAAGAWYARRRRQAG